MMRQSVTTIHELFNSNFHVDSLSDAGGANLGRGSGQVEQAQARKIITLPEAFLYVLLFELRELGRRHPSSIGRKLAIHFAANVEFLVDVRREMDRRHPS